MSSSASAATAFPRPPLVVIVADQLRPDVLGCYGGACVPTPHLDALAAQGLVFDQAVSSCPVCVPARSALLTGVHPLKSGVIHNGYWLRPDRAALGLASWPERLAAAGYRTAAIGKMHFYPWDASEGFEDRIIAEDKRWFHIEDDYSRFLAERGLGKRHGREAPGYAENKGAILAQVPADCTVDRFVADQAANYIRDYADSRPPAIVVSLPSPHCPYDPTPEALARVRPEKLPPPIQSNGLAPDLARLREEVVRTNRAPWNGVDYSEFTAEQIARVRAHYAGLVHEVDAAVGRVLEALRARGWEKQALVVFSSDHGDFLGDHGLIGKGLFLESALRVPLIVRGPGVAVGSRSDALVEFSDIHAATLRAAGLTPPAWLDARPLPGVAGETAARRHILGGLRAGFMLRTAEWKLCWYHTGDRHFFDLRGDPQERHNLIDSAEPRVRAARAELESLLARELCAAFAGAHADKRIPDVFADPAFNAPGWRRPYPAPV